MNWIFSINLFLLNAILVSAIIYNENNINCPYINLLYSDTCEYKDVIYS